MPHPVTAGRRLISVVLGASIEAEPAKGEAGAVPEDPKNNDDGSDVEQREQG